MLRHKVERLSSGDARRVMSSGSLRRHTLQDVQEPDARNRRRRMGKLIYSMFTSLDGYAEAAEGDLGTGADDAEVHSFVGDVFRPVGTYLYGRRMYETMVYWETAHLEPDQPPHILQFAR